MHEVTKLVNIFPALRYALIFKKKLNILQNTVNMPKFPRIPKKYVMFDFPKFLSPMCDSWLPGRIRNEFAIITQMLYYKIYTFHKNKFYFKHFR